MADPIPTRLHIDPPIGQWRVKPRHGRSKPIIATGHQPTLWHPGILAKDLAADAFAQSVGGTTRHVAVTHNPLGPLSIEVPSLRDEALRTHRVALGNRGASMAMPPNRLPPIDPLAVERAMHELAGQTTGDGIAAGVGRLAQAYLGSAEATHLAAQTTAVLDKLKQPYLHAPMQTLPTSELVTQGFVERLLVDPVGCARSYNRAALAYPEAGVRPLYVGRDVVEAPLWAQGDGRCTPVFVDLGDSAKPQLFTQGQSLDLTSNDALKHLRPRAITLSAIMRSEHCDLFIHGTGGGVYDQVTERWWHDWVGEGLAPMAVVSADLYLPLNTLTATRDELAQAVWYAHHLPHNVDRYASANDETLAASIAEKRALLDSMNDDRDKRRRAKAFKRINAINAQLRAHHEALLREAVQSANQARVGVRNSAVARRRDWCFALYPEGQLADLRLQIERGINAKG